MKGKQNYIYIFMLVLGLISFAGICAVYPGLPDIIPTHFDFNGKINGFGSKATLFAMAAMPIVFPLVFWALPKIDPRRKNYDKHKKAYGIISILISIFPILMTWTVVFQAMGYNMQIGRVVPALVGILLIVIGNFMPQMRPNYFMGIRSPWALDNPYVWKKTHAFGGIVFCIMGVIMIAAPFLPEAVGLPLAVGTVFGGTILTYLYSYRIYVKYKNKNDDQQKFN